MLVLIYIDYEALSLGQRSFLLQWVLVNAEIPNWSKCREAVDERDNTLHMYMKLLKI